MMSLNDEVLWISDCRPFTSMSWHQFHGTATTPARCPSSAAVASAVVDLRTAKWLECYKIAILKGLLKQAYFCLGKQADFPK